MATPVFIHVGFANTGTTSLQRNFFARRKDIFFVGEPYEQRGGIFTNIKSVEDFKYDASHIGELCQRDVVAAHGGRTVVISDESLCDAPELYFAPYMMPRDIIARRLRHLFPGAKIIFTIRDQRHYVASMYSTLKRNAAFFDRMPMPPFSRWLEGMLSAVRRSYLCNLNYTEAIGLYASLFGRSNICILPLEAVSIDGAEAYLRKLCQFMSVNLTDADIKAFDTIHNRRMSVRRNLAAELMGDDRFNDFLTELVEAFGREGVEAFLDGGRTNTFKLQASDDDRLRRHIGLGNWLLAREFDLDLSRYGYPIMDVGDFNAAELGLAEEEFNFAHDLVRLLEGRTGEHAAKQRLEAEVISMRARLAEFAAVSQSPVWRAVSVLDRTWRFALRVRAKTGNGDKRIGQPSATQL
jgi:hypothetical protein